MVARGKWPDLEETLDIVRPGAETLSLSMINTPEGLRKRA